tara:strand:- start:1 stop:201 length:201 start_codon:yes stop_codon:yes gene_type:complete
MQVGDLVKMNSTYPIWLLSVGIKKKDIGIILKVYDSYNNSSNKVEVFWFSVGKKYVLQQKVLTKVN